MMMDSQNDPPPPPFLAPPPQPPTLLASSTGSSSSPAASLPHPPPPPKPSPSSSETELLLQSKEHHRLHVFRDKPMFSSSSSPSSPSLPSLPGFRRSAAVGAFAPSPADHKIASFRELSCPRELEPGCSFQTEPAIAEAPSSAASSMTGKGQAGCQTRSRHGPEAATHLSSPSSSHPSSQRPPRPGANSSTLDAAAAEDGEVPRPLEALQAVPIPPFLSKTYDFVDDASLDPVVSWGPNGQSFVVWDPVEFSRTVLPRHFKHNNFSSFVRQLNTYDVTLNSESVFRSKSLSQRKSTVAQKDEGKGFHKIDADRWEFSNEDFLRGHKHLLRHIHRRRSSHVQQIGSYVGSSMELGGFGVEDEVEKMRKDKNLLTQEVAKLQREHVTMIRQLETVKQRMQSAELKQERLVSFLARALQNPAFLNHLRQEKEQRKLAPSRITRRYLKHPKANDIESVSLCERQVVKNYGRTVDGVSSSCANRIMEANVDVVSSLANQVTEISTVPYQLLDHLFQEVADKLDVNEEFTPAPAEAGGGRGVFAFMDAGCDSLLRGEDVMDSPTDAASAAAAAAEYLVSFPEAAAEEGEEEEEEENNMFLNVIAEENEGRPVVPPTESWDMSLMLDGTNLLLDHPSCADDVWDALFEEEEDARQQGGGAEAGSSVSWHVDMKAAKSDFHPRSL